MSDGVSLVKTNIYFLQQGIDLLEQISDDHYVATDGTNYKSGVGKHMRHILDHYASLLEGTDNRINYDDRDREARIETDREYAINESKAIVEGLKKFLHDPERLNDEVRVKSNEGEEAGNAPWSKSSISRELQFLISHTVHHYALMAVILRIQGFSPPEDFGIAPSTLKHYKSLAEKDH